MPIEVTNKPDGTAVLHLPMYLEGERYNMLVKVNGSGITVRPVGKRKGLAGPWKAVLKALAPIDGKGMAAYLGNSARFIRDHAEVVTT